MHHPLRTVFAAAAAALLSFKVLAASAPHVMRLIDEKSLGTIATSEIEAMAVQMLLDNNLRVVDQDMVRANLKKDQQMLKSVGDNELCQSWIAAQVAVGSRVKHFRFNPAEHIAQVEIAVDHLGHVAAADGAEIPLIAFGHSLSAH